jgi:hypothetical protein
MKNLVFSACALVVVFSAACKKKTDGPPPPELSVKLIDPGEEPRAPLLYSIETDTRMRSLLEVYDIEASTERSEEAEDAFGVMPGVKLLLHVGPTVSLPQGTRYVLRIENAEAVLPDGISARQIDETEAGVRALREMQGRFDVNRQGVVMDADVPWEEGQGRINPRMAIMIGNLRSAVATIPLPSEPVGIGGMWEVRRPLRIWSAFVTQVTRYELTDRVGDRFRVAITVEQEAAPQIADLNPKLEMHVRSFETHARGHALADLGLPLVLEAQLESDSAAEIALVSPEKTEPLESARRTVLRLTSERER